MFDNLREDANSTPFYEDEARFEEAEAITPAPRRRARASGAPFLGLSPVQRFVLAFMLLMAVCALGSMCLLITGKIGLF